MCAVNNHYESHTCQEDPVFLKVGSLQEVLLVLKEKGEMINEVEASIAP